MVSPKVLELIDWLPGGWRSEQPVTMPWAPSSLLTHTVQGTALSVAWERPSLGLATSPLPTAGLGLPRHSCPSQKACGGDGGPETQNTDVPGPAPPATGKGEGTQFRAQVYSNPL